jgi:uncharacterized protein YbjQ (UPF0145 family)
MPACTDCGKNLRFYNSIDGRCPDCHFALRMRELEANAPAASATPGQDATPEIDVSHIVLSTEAAPDLKVAERIDIVSAEFAVGMGLLTDIFNAWRDVFGGRSKSYQNALKDARRTVLDELRREAHAVGADAVLGVKLDYSEISGGGKSMLFLVASGTAVTLAGAA